MTPYRPIAASAIATTPTALTPIRAQPRRQQRRRHLRVHRLVVEEDDVRLERRDLAAHGAQQRAGIAASARDDDLAAARPLRHGVVHVRRRRLADGADFVIGRNADDLHFGAVEACVTRKRLPIASWFGQYLRAIASLTMATPRRGRRVRRREVAALQDRDAERREILRRNARDVDDHALVVRPMPIRQEHRCCGCS